MASTTKTKHEPLEPESSAISNGVQSYDDTAEMMESWRVRGLALANEVQFMGGSCVVMFGLFDPIPENDDDADISYRRTSVSVLRRGNYHTVLGMLEDAKHAILSNS